MERRLMLSAYGFNPISYFAANDSGARPASALVADAGGNLFGVASKGGRYGAGTVFEIAAGSGAVTALVTFNGAPGEYAGSGLAIDAAGNLYGVSQGDGDFGDGTVFEVARGSNAMTTLASLSGSVGQHVGGQLTIDAAGDLFGTTSLTGTAARGSVFEIAAGSNAATTLASFSARYPSPGLTLDGAGNLFGTTPSTAGTDYGSVFEIAAGSTAATTLATFYGTGASNPLGGVAVDSSGNLYGTIDTGGFNGWGEVFEVAAGSNTITRLASFNSPANGQKPNAGVTLDASGNLYGTTSQGAANGYGAVWEVAKGSSAITALVAFSGTNGSAPEAGLTLDGSGNLYGSTNGGGANAEGSVFEIGRASASITTLAAFAALTGSLPRAGLAVDAAGNLFGTTGGGVPASVGPSGDPNGSVFEIAAGSTTLTTLVVFNGANGANPNAVLTLDTAGNVYGTTDDGGDYGDGTVFTIAHGSSALTTIVSFTGANGAYPITPLTLDSSGNLYGTTSSGGVYGYGEIFEIPKGSNTLSVLYAFTYSGKSSPPSGLTVDAAGNLYGTFNNSVFELANGSKAITTLAFFSPTYVRAGVTLDAAGNLYGTTNNGGPAADGTVFEIPAGSTTVTTIASFGGSNGSVPDSGVILDSSHNLFGSTYQGGPQNFGTVFEIAAGSNAITTLASFNGNNGEYPAGPLALDGNGRLYGVTEFGGPAGEGTIYAMTPASAVALSGSPVINGDNPDGLFNAFGQTTPGQQRSMVEDVVYTFNEPVAINDANAAFTVALAGTAGGTLPTTLYAQAVSGSNGTQWAVSLSGQPEGTIGSIANGEYRITINPAYVVAAADGTTQLSAGRTDTFYRLYGDVFGTEAVTNADYNLFKKSINTYNPVFDYFANGQTSSNADYNVFKKDLNISYSGFVTTI
jgi:uncharacterized repeat protein (TIGR03803 family)